MRRGVLPVCDTSRAGLIVAAFVGIFASGCNPYTTGAKIGIKLVGEAVNEADVSDHAKKLIGQPPAQANAVFGQPTEQLEEIRMKRDVYVYPVKGDALSMFAWVVEAHDGRIVDLSKVQRESPDAMEMVKKVVLKEKLVGKPAAQIQQDKKYQTPMLVLRSRATGNLVRVYDVTSFTDMLGAKYCVMRFDASDRCEMVRLVGVPASTRQKKQ